MPTVDELEESLQELISELNWTIRKVREKIKHEPYLAQDPNGRYIMLDALAAKATATVALAQLTMFKENRGH